MVAFLIYTTDQKSLCFLIIICHVFQEVFILGTLGTRGLFLASRRDRPEAHPLAGQNIELKPQTAQEKPLAPRVHFWLRRRASETGGK